MQPTHHVHISTGFMLVIVLGVIGVAALIVWARRKPAERIIERTVIGPDGSWSTTRGPSIEPQPSCFVRSRSSDNTPAPAPVIVNQGGGGSDFLTGMLIAEALAPHAYPVPVAAPVYVEPAPSYDPAPPCDSGFSYDSGPSVDTGSSGGFDFSW